MIDNKDQTEVTTWFDSHIQALSEAEGLKEDLTEAHKEAVLTLTRVNRMVKYLENRIAELSTDLREIEIFGTQIEYTLTLTRINELQRLMEASNEEL